MIFVSFLAVPLHLLQLSWRNRASEKESDARVTLSAGMTVVRREVLGQPPAVSGQCFSGLGG